MECSDFRGLQPRRVSRRLVLDMVGLTGSIPGRAPIRQVENRATLHCPEQTRAQRWRRRASRGKREGKGVSAPPKPPTRAEHAGSDYRPRRHAVRFLARVRRLPAAFSAEHAEIEGSAGEGDGAPRGWRRKSPARGVAGRAESSSPFRSYNRCATGAAAAPTTRRRQAQKFSESRVRL